MNPQGSADVRPAASALRILDKAALSARVESLRGPAGGYSRAHAGLAAFWREQHHEIIARDPTLEEEEVLARLQQWLASEQSFALVIGDDSTRTAVLARFAVLASNRRPLELIFLPVSGCFGTAAEQEAFQIMEGQRLPQESAHRSRPRSPNELRSLLYAGSSGAVDEGDPELLLMIDGIERAADWAPDRGRPFLGRGGHGIHILVSVPGEPSAADASEWRRRLGWSEEMCLTLNLPSEAQQASKSAQLVARVRALVDQTPEQVASTRAALDALACCFAPIELAALVGTCGLPPSAGQSLPPSSDTLSALVVEEDDGTWRFRSDGLRSLWRTGFDATSVERGIAERGLELLARPEGHHDWPSYLVKYLAVHWARTSIPIANWAQLVTPRWLHAWLQQGPGVVGFITGARHARDAAERVLREAESSDQEQREALELVVWCALVEGALFEKEGSSTVGFDDALPYQEGTLDLKRPLNAENSIAINLSYLQLALTGADSDLVAAWAAEAIAAVPGGYSEAPNPDTGMPFPPLRWDLNAPPREPSPSATRQMRSGNPDSIGVCLENDAGVAAASIGAEECLTLGLTAPAYLRAGGLAQLVPWLPESLRSLATREALLAYRESEESTALRFLFACAPWMTRTDAAWLLCHVLGNGHPRGLKERLVGWDGLNSMIPLLERIGGSAVLLDTAALLTKLMRWLG